MSHDFRFDLRGAYPETFRLDHFVRARDKVEISLLVAISPVAAENQDFARKPRMRAKYLGGIFRVAPVSLRHRSPAMHQLADGIRRALLTVLIQYHDLAVGDRLADRGRVDVELVRIQIGRSEGFRQTEHGKDLRLCKRRLEIADHILRQAPTGGTHVAQ